MNIWALDLNLTVILFKYKWWRIHISDAVLSVSVGMTKSNSKRHRLRPSRRMMVRAGLTVDLTIFLKFQTRTRNWPEWTNSYISWNQERCLIVLSISAPRFISTSQQTNGIRFHSQNLLWNLNFSPDFNIVGEYVWRDSKQSNGCFSPC